MKFLVKNAIWIVVILVVPVALILIYFSIRGSSPKEEKEEEHREPRIVARIPTADDEEEEGPRRVLPGSDAALAQAADVEREYALVVKEEDLKMPPLPEEGDSSRHKKVDSAPIKNLMERQNFDEAYQQYIECIDMDGKSELNPDLERKLGEHFIRAGQLDKAARVLEHHVATHTREEINPETYFNLAYIHFRGKTINKSRRYFRLFVERHKDPVQVERAKNILARLDRVQNRN